jgi:hypothetical protein
MKRRDVAIDCPLSFSKKVVRAPALLLGDFNRG